MFESRAVFLLALGALTAHAQTTGAIHGTALDPVGLALADARVEIADPANGAARSVSTGADGVYLAPNLPPGAYRLTISHEGFRSMSLENVEVRAGYTARGDFRLQLGEVRETIVVQAETPLVSTSASDWGGSIGRKQLDVLPLRNRDTFDLVAQQPGASIPTNTNKGLVQGLGTLFSVNGSRPWQNAFRLDGVTVNESAGGAPSSASGTLLGIEALQEVQLITSPFSAEFGRATGGVFTAVSRSGSNDLHGSAYGFLRNEALDAKNYFDSQTTRIPPLRKQQFGGVISGPLLRNKLFVLGNYEGIRLNSGTTSRLITLTADGRRGILAPGSAPVPVSPKIMPFLDVYPLPNGRDLGNGTGEYAKAVLTDSREHFMTGKADWVPTSRLRSAVRYSFDRGNISAPDPYEHWRFDNVSRYHIVHGETTFLASPTDIFNFRFGYSRVLNSLGPEAISSVARNLSFLPGRTLGVLRVTGLDSTGSSGLGTVGSLPRQNQIEDFQFNHDASLIRGAHVVRYGAGYDRIRFNQRADVGYYGVYRFTSIVDFLAARPATGDMMSLDSDSRRSFRQNLFYGFLQDEWRVTRHVQVVLGLRYDTYSTPTEVNGKIATLRDVVRDTQTHVGGPLFENPSRLNFAPRAAIAWDVTGDGHTVVRAGGGLFFDTISTRDLQIAGMRMPPFFVRLAPVNPSFPDLASSANLGVAAVRPDTLDYHQKQPYVAQFQFRLERQLGANTVVQAGYAGSRGIHLMGFMDNINTPVPQRLPDGRLFIPANATRVNPAFDQIATRRSQFDSYYHAMNLFVQRRFRGGLQFQAKYTWSKSIDNNSMTIFNDFNGDGGFPAVFDYRSNRGLSDFDVRHEFAGSFIWQVPGPSTGLAGNVLGGWAVDGLIQARAGQPISPTIGFDQGRLLPASGDQGQRPDATGVAASQSVLGQVNRWFDPTAFSLPQPGFIGTLGRNTIPGPGLFATDMALRKAVWRTDRQTITLRAEFYNLTNHPNFSNPATNDMQLFDSRGRRLETAGRIVSTSTTSRQTQVSLRWSF